MVLKTARDLQLSVETFYCNVYLLATFSSDASTGFLLLCRIHFPWLFQTKWIIFPD